ncbi:hypothetical protein PUN28_002224 [Cardiocondyla obscurior]|uniref:Protein yippee-like n=1 Tax=Cardiocondyla obscurior TaxID=286306 RepID=A0AAW2GSX7_9HYME
MSATPPALPHGRILSLFHCSQCDGGYDLNVVINIQLNDVSNYYLRIKNDCLHFSTETNSKKYFLILYLYGGVVAEKTVHKSLEEKLRSIFLVLICQICELNIDTNFYNRANNSALLEAIHA